jgi:hypothetical protein
VLYCIPRVKVSVTVSTRSVRLSVPVIYSDIRSYNERDLAFNYTKLALAAIECKLAMCISKLVKLELLLELKIEQKTVLCCIPRVIRLRQA